MAAARVSNSSKKEENLEALGDQETSLKVIEFIEEEDIDITGPEFSNLCVTTNRSGEILVGNEKGCHLFSPEKGRIIRSFQAGNDDISTEVPSALFSNENENTIMFATDHIIKIADLRQKRDSVITFEDNSDEINELSSCRKHLAACDDSGEVKIFDLTANKLYRTLRNKHTNICSSVCSRNNSANELFSGGLDCQLIRWNYAKIKPLQTSNTQQLFKNTGDDSAYMFNPPMVNSIDCSEDGSCIIAGLGNGSIAVYEFNKNKKLMVTDIIKQHSTLGTTCAKFVNLNDSCYVISGGNDCKLNFINFTLEQGNDDSNKTRNLLSSVSLTSKINNFTSYKYNDNLILLVCDQTGILKRFNVKCS